MKICNILLSQTLAMKILHTTYIIIVLALICTNMASCDGASDVKKNDVEAVDQLGPEYTSEYICPMHCAGSGSDEPGKCPVCGMDYVLNDKSSDDVHNHEDHEGHNH